MSTYPFRQVDVFAGGPLAGNPVAVVLEADDVDPATMQDFARWTNLSETTFVLTPTDATADYRLRIFTPAAELPFAGHPTLGSACAWLQHTGRDAGPVVQQCVAGLIEVRGTPADLAFAAPPLIRSGDADPQVRATAARALALPDTALLDAAWVDNGPGWLAVRLADARAVLALAPDFDRMPFPIGVIGAHPADGPADFEVRAFVPGLGVPEDPVTGSLNAGIGTWFADEGRIPLPYTVRQGTAIGRNGLVRVFRADDRVWVGGACEGRVSGRVEL